MHFQGIACDNFSILTCKTQLFFVFFISEQKISEMLVFLSFVFFHLLNATNSNFPRFPEPESQRMLGCYCTLGGFRVSVSECAPWIASAERNNKAEPNVKSSLSNFNAGSANKGVKAYSNFCSLHINIWRFTWGNENLSRVIKEICLYEVKRTPCLRTSSPFWPRNNARCEIGRPYTAQFDVPLQETLKSAPVYYS